MKAYELTTDGDHEGYFLTIDGAIGHIMNNFNDFNQYFDEEEEGFFNDILELYLNKKMYQETFLNELQDHLIDIREIYINE